MTALDISILIIIVGLGGVSGLVNGFMRTAMGLIAVAVGIFFASRFWSYLVPLLNGIFKNEPAAKWMSVALILIIVSIATDSLLRQVQKIIEKGALGWINHLVGAVFGVAVASLLLGFVLLLLSQYGNDFLTKAINNSRFGLLLVSFARHTIGISKTVLNTGYQSSSISFFQKASLFFS